jgi:hypothetical protein
MKVVGKTITAAAGIAAAMAVAVAPGVSATPGATAAAKTRTVNINAAFTQSGTKLTGTYSGKPWGKGKATGTLVIPTATLTFHTKIGTATLRYDGTIYNGTKVKGDWKWIKGTGKLKGIKGGGKARGDLSGKFKYTGTARY